MNVSLVPDARMNVGEFLAWSDTRILKDGDIVLDPPGLSVSVAGFLGEED
jgi:hypothetical protein